MPGGWGGLAPAGSIAENGGVVRMSTAPDLGARDGLSSFEREAGLRAPEPAVGRGATGSVR